ncbi:MAG: hypothetical protein AAGG65_21015 [Pseudomonadota bacterium]
MVHLCSDNPKLVALHIEDDRTPGDALAIYAAHRRDRVLGPAGRWLLDALRQRLSAVIASSE